MGRRRVSGATRHRDDAMLRHMERARRPVVPQAVIVKAATVDAEDAPVDALAAELLRRELQP